MLFRSLTEITDSETNEKYEYRYNFQGIRTQKKVGNTIHKYYLDGTRILQETRTIENTVNRLKYYYGTTGVVGFEYNGNEYYYILKSRVVDRVTLYRSGEYVGAQCKNI